MSKPLNVSGINASIYVITWNVSTKHPENIVLNNLLGLESSAESDKHLPDVYVIGLQEVSSQPQNVVINLFKEDPWTNKLKEVLKERDYCIVKTEQMQGLLVILFVRRKHLLHIREIETDYTRTGLGGIWGNKGAVSIRMRFYGCGICMINSHLAAHDHELDERVADFKQILGDHHYHVKRYEQIFDHDYVFWFGDLNFRLTGETTTSPQEIRNLVHNEKLDELLEKDQLTLVRSQKKAFHQLDERLPAFPPTFKFETGTSEYDMKRRPAWTDRILHKVKPATQTSLNLSSEQTSYKSHPGYNISDHKPVSSEFTIKVCDRPVDLIVEFSHIPVWQIGEENIIEFTIPEGFEDQASDWIGVYRSDFSSLNDYIAYEYTSGSDTKQTLTSHTIKHSINLEFSDNIDLTENNFYILLYFQSTGIRGITGLAGMSNVFKAEKRPPSPRFDSVD